MGGTTAHCVGEDPERFFPRKGTSPQVVERTKAICLDPPCPLLEKCLDWALAHEHRGIWAGTTETERRQERKARGVSVQSPSWADTITAAINKGRNATCWECGKTMLVSSLGLHEERYH
jgi:WhiB family redox-sensing transcriptional regulator